MTTHTDHGTRQRRPYPRHKFNDGDKVFASSAEHGTVHGTVRSCNMLSVTLNPSGQTFPIDNVQLDPAAAQIDSLPTAPNVNFPRIDRKDDSTMNRDITDVKMDARNTEAMKSYLPPLPFKHGDNVQIIADVPEDWHVDNPKPGAVGEVVSSKEGRGFRGADGVLVTKVRIGAADIRRNWKDILSHEYLVHIPAKQPAASEPAHELLHQQVTVIVRNEPQNGTVSAVTGSAITVNFGDGSSGDFKADELLWFKDGQTDSPTVFDEIAEMNATNPLVTLPDSIAPAAASALPPVPAPDGASVDSKPGGMTSLEPRYKRDDILISGKTGARLLVVNHWNGLTNLQVLTDSGQPAGDVFMLEQAQLDHWLKTGQRSQSETGETLSTQQLQRIIDSQNVDMKVMYRDIDKLKVENEKLRTSTPLPVPVMEAESNELRAANDRLRDELERTRKALADMQASRDEYKRVNEQQSAMLKQSMPNPFPPEGDVVLAFLYEWKKQGQVITTVADKIDAANSDLLDAVEQATPDKPPVQFVPRIGDGL